MNGHAHKQPNDFDVICVGAGISGVVCGYRLQEMCPDRSYAILEARGGIGGTWDFFKYPGLRSDSDLETFGFSFNPWLDPRNIAPGEEIRKYVIETAEKFGIDKHVKFHHKVVACHWSSETQQWRLDVDNNGNKKTFYAGWIIWSSGYYNYVEPLAAKITDIDKFKGTVVHPQFWPKDLDWSNKRITLIGSGATSVTLLPVLAETAAHCTLVQRSPTYILSMPQVDPMGSAMRKVGLPIWLVYKVLRFKALTLPFLFFKFCRAYPNAAKRIMRARTKRELPPHIPHAPHFEPSYNPWEQRLCLAPNGDFYKCLREGSASIATGHIKAMNADTVFMESGEEIKSDIIITATGLNIQFVGGADLDVDGKPVVIHDHYLWKQIMLDSLPNTGFVIGYTNASWTLGADATAQHLCRLMNQMKERGHGAVTPVTPKHDELEPLPALNLNSTYVVKALERMPRAAKTNPWGQRASYWTDLYEARFGSLDDKLQFTKAVSA